MAFLSQPSGFALITCYSFLVLAPPQQDVKSNDIQHNGGACPDVGGCVFPGHYFVDKTHLGRVVPVEEQIPERVEYDEEDVSVVELEPV